MAFFGNDAVNRVNLHYAIQALAMGAGRRLLLRLPAACRHLGAGDAAGVPFVVAGRFVLRPLIIPLGKRWGLKPLVIVGALMHAVQYPILA